MAAGWGLQSTHWEDVPQWGEAQWPQFRNCSGGHRGGIPRHTRRVGTCEDIPQGRLLGRSWSWWGAGHPGGDEGHSLERVHAKGHVHARAVGQEGSEGRLLKQPKDQDLVPGGTGRARPKEPNRHSHPQRQKHTRRQMERQRWRSCRQRETQETGKGRSNEMATLKGKDRE